MDVKNFHFFFFFFPLDESLKFITKKVYHIPWLNTYPKKFHGKQNKKYQNNKETDTSMIIEGENTEINDEIKERHSEILKENLIMARNKKIMQNICVWILNDLVIPLLRANFYCTEKHSEGSKIFYYR